MMNLLLPSHYFVLIPSVLTIMMVSRVHPFPYTETKSWIHSNDQHPPQEENQLVSSHHKVNRSSFVHLCPDCLSQKKASLSLLLLPTHKKKQQHDYDDQDDELLYEKMVELLMLPEAAASTTATIQQAAEELSNETTLVQNSSGSGNSRSLASYYYSRSRRKIEGGREEMRSSAATDSHKLVGLVDVDDDGDEGDLNKKQNSRRKIRDTTSGVSTTPCLTEREERLRIAHSTRSTEYIPVCRRNGSYRSLQCHPSTRSCWCVTRNGSPIPGSSFLSSDSGTNVPRSNCAKYNRRAKSTTRRRSSQFRKNRKCTGINHSSCVTHDDLDDFDSSDSEDPFDDDSDDDDDDDEFSAFSCNQADWSRFNAALLKTFRSEYNRYRALTSMNSDMETASDTTVLAWKFDHVDRNKDMILQRNETNILKNLVKQQIQPRSCAKNFIASCSNGDHQITKSEWLDCLRVSSDVNLPYDTFNSLVDSSTSRGMHPSLLLKPVSSSSASGSGSASIELTPPLLSSSTIGETTEQSNCWTDRQSALASQKQNIPDANGIIPECTANGNYRKVQCAQGKAYCWCVEEESGVQIPNTVVINSTPDCNNGYSKPMKGCSVAKKHKFLMDLFSSLKARMLEATRDDAIRGQGDISRNMSPEELSSRWYFSQLDVNSNGVLDRKEWKTFRNETSLDKRLKKCGKKLPRHCDVNQDKNITMTEWLDCLGVKFLGRIPTHSSTKRPVNRSHVPRPGKNPFTTILKHR